MTAAEKRTADKAPAKKKDRVLAAFVYVDGTGYPAGSTPPDDVAEQITNPKAWVQADEA